MGENTKIQWTDDTFNPWIGCTKVSAACDNCYAEAKWDKRLHRVKWGAGEARSHTAASTWREPIKWNKKAVAAGVRRRVFCASIADVFDAEVPDDWRVELMGLIGATPALDWQLLTKRPQVARKWAEAHGLPDNVWLGATVEDQKMAELRIPILLGIPAKVRFLSCEPLLEKLTLKPEWLPGLDWIICGGESGRGARMMPEDRARDLRDQCKAAGVSFFMKQMTKKAPIPDDLMVREFPT